MYKFIIIVILLSVASMSYCQYNNHDFSIGLYGVYTTSASIYLNPNSNDVVLRNESFDIEDIFNPGVDIRYKIAEAFILGLDIEYIKTTAFGQNLTAFDTTTIVTLNVEDGFRLIPIEFSAYYLLPFSTEDFKFLMGGGIAYYDGEFIRKVGDAGITNVEKQAAYGIHVSVSMDYMLRENIAINFSMKFRDPQFTVKSKYNKSNIRYGKYNIHLPRDSFETKTDMDGISFMLGIAFQI
jgi:outer membrane protein W